MDQRISEAAFGYMIRRYCERDVEFRHEIERERAVDAFSERFQLAYQGFSQHAQSLREAFGLSARGIEGAGAAGRSQ